MDKRFFVFLILGLFMISFVSAELITWDNWKTCDDVTREVVIKDLTGEIGKARLNTPLYNKVEAGKDKKVAEFDLYAYEDYNDILKSFDFYDKTKTDWENNKINKEFDIKYKVTQTNVIDDFEYQCTDKKLLSNGTMTQDCEFVVVGSHTEEEEVWKKVTPAVLKKNEVVTVGIFTDVEVGEFVEWIPSIYGVRVTEWASYEGTGGTITTDGDYTIHTFNENGTFALTGSEITNVSVLIVAGGGSGGAAHGGGGGAGGVIYLENQTISVGTYPVVVGIGGNRTEGEWSLSPDTTIGKNGTNSSFNGFNAMGGGGGGANTNNPALVFQNGYFGGSGGGGSTSQQGNGAGGSGLAGQGYAGGSSNGPNWMGGGGGGANGTGGTSSATGGNGGAGFTTSINGSSTCWAGGGGGNVAGSGTCGGTDGIEGAITSDDATRGGGSGGSMGLGAGYGGNGTVIIRYLTTAPNDAPDITLNDPTVDANYTSPQTITFNFTASDTEGQLSDVKIYVNTVLNQTNATGINNSDYLFDLDLGDGDYVIYGKATDNESQETSTGSIRIVIDSTAPTLTNATNLTDQTTFVLPINSSWNYTATDTHIDQCYYNTTANATQTVIPCNSSIVTTWTTGGNKTLTYCANDTFGLETCRTNYLYIYYITDAQGESEDPTVEGSTVTWNLSVDMTNIPTTTATLVINGTNYAPTTTLSDANGYLFEVTKQIPDTWGNTTGNLLNWSWNYTIDGVVTSQQMDQENITVYELAVDDCSTYGDVILEMNLKDEETANLINGSAGSNVEIDLEITSMANSSIGITYNKTWTNNVTPQICLPYEVLNDTQWSFDFTVGFSSTDHVWEFFYLDNGTLNSSKVYDVQTQTPINLFDLLTTDSTSFLFNYFDQDGLPVTNSIVHVYRKYIGSGVFREVERAKADQNGDTIVHLVEEDVIYKFVISLGGDIIYTTAEYTALCQATPCTIQIEASGTGATFDDDWDLIDGGAYTISSSASTREVTLDYALDEAGTMNFTVYRYESDGSYAVINTTSDTGTSGSIVLDVPQSAGNVSFFASVVKDDEFINSEWVNFVGNPQDRFGITMSLFLAFLIILSLGLMAVSEGVGTLVWVILGVFLSGALGLITLELSTGVNVVIYLIIAGGIILWKLTGGRR